MSLSTEAIETGFVTRYRGDTTLQGLLGNPAHASKSVFDSNGVPVGYPFPYVVVNIITEQLGTAFTSSKDGTDSYVQMSIFTETGPDGGFAEARAIAIEIYSLTHGQALDLTSSGFNQFFCLFKSKQEIPDGMRQHIPLLFQLMTQNT